MGDKEWGSPEHKNEELRKFQEKLSDIDLDFHSLCFCCNIKDKDQEKILERLNSLYVDIETLVETSQPYDYLICPGCNSGSGRCCCSGEWIDKLEVKESPL